MFINVWNTNALAKKYGTGKPDKIPTIMSSLRDSMLNAYQMSSLRDSMHCAYHTTFNRPEECELYA